MILILLLFSLFIPVNLSAFEYDDEDDTEYENPPVRRNNSNPFFSITEKEVEAFFRAEYNRSSIFYGEMSVLGGIEFYNLLKLKGGISIGRTKGSTDLNSFIRVNYSPFARIPLNFSLAYIYNGIPEYEAHSHSLLPFITYGASRAGISAGVNFRFSSFFGEKPQFESLLSFYGYVNIVNTNSLIIRIGAGTFSDFYAKNIGAYSLKINIDIYLDSKWSILNELELMQSGGNGFSTNFYGFAWRGGARYSW